MTQRLTERQKAHAEITALRMVAEQVNATAQLAVRGLHAVASREINLSRLDGPAGSLVVIRTPEGKDLDPGVGEQMSRLLGLPVVSIPGEFGVSTIDPETLARHGFTYAPPAKDGDQP